MIHAPPLLPECPIHVGCPIVNGCCSCGEPWFGATLELQQAVRLGLLMGDSFAVGLLCQEDVSIAFTDAIEPFTRNGDSAETQLAALAKASPKSVAAYQARRANGAPLPSLRLTDPVESGRMVSWMNAPNRKANLTIDASIPDRVMLCHRGTAILRIPTPEQEYHP